MQYQTFRGADLKDALNRVKAVLGPDAVIESTRQVSNGRGGGFGQSFVEVKAAGPNVQPVAWPFTNDITSATEAAPAPRPVRAPARAPLTRGRPWSRDAELSREGARPVDGERGAASQPFGHREAERRRDGESQEFPWNSGLSPHELEKELRALRSMLEELNLARPPKEKAFALLHAAGIEGRLAKELANGAGRIARLGDDALRRWLLERLSARLRANPGLIARPRRQLIACVGPTGAGKTTTLAKLAAHARLEHGRSVGVISLDTFRVGAVEQWQRYAQLMGVAFNIARRAEEFQRAIATSTCDLIFVDTSGRGVADTPETWPLAECLTHVTRHELHVLVVLPAWLRGRDAEQVVQSYADVRPTGVVFTKLDEAAQFGGVVQAAIGGDLPLAYTCHGPRVPEDIRDAEVGALLAQLFPPDA